MYSIVRQGRLLECRFRGWTQDDFNTCLRNPNPFSTFCVVGYWNEAFEKTSENSCLVFAFGLLDNTPFASAIHRQLQGSGDTVVFFSKREQSHFGPYPTVIPPMGTGRPWLPYRRIMEGMRLILLEETHSSFARLRLDMETDKALDMWIQDHFCCEFND
jgi:hypothetical protein